MSEHPPFGLKLEPQAEPGIIAEDLFKNKVLTIKETNFIPNLSKDKILTFS